MKHCPNCALYVRRDTVKCPHCGAYISKSLHGLVPPDPAIASYAQMVRPAGENALDTPATRRRRHARGIAAMLAILAVFYLTWYLERRGVDPATHPLPITFEEFERVFGPDSPMTPEEKDAAFRQYRGKTVRWEGTIVYLNTADEPEPHVSLRHRGGASSPVSDVTLYPRPRERDKLGRLRVGDHLLYTGALVEYGPDGAPVTVQDGRIVGNR